jgi:ribosomal protein L35AE/L33A
LTKLIAEIDTKEELKLAIDVINRHTRNLNDRKRAQFHVGQNVEWSSKLGFVTTGTITKIMDEKVLVDAGADGVWCVSPDILCLVE